jgi:hypothetical protein
MMAIRFASFLENPPALEVAVGSYRLLYLIKTMEMSGK